MTRRPHPRCIRLDSRPAYAKVMAAAWAEHLAPKSDDAPTVVSTFAGCGGSSLGYSMAGFREVLAVEWNPNAVQAFKVNYPHVPLFEGDIANLSDEEALRLAGLKRGELTVFDGSPPCQGFSTAGRRIMDDPRNSLFKEYIRLMRAFNPKAFVFENVSGMVKGKMRLTFVEILRELKSQGYQVSCRLLNAQWFDVPQARQRVIFIGIRSDLGIEPRHPAVQPGVRIWSLRDVLPALMSTRSQRINPWMDGEGPAATLCATATGYEAETSTGVRLVRRAHGWFPGMNSDSATDRPSPALIAATGSNIILEIPEQNVENSHSPDTIDDAYPSKRANPHSVDRPGRSIRTTGRFYLNEVDEPQVDNAPIGRIDREAVSGAPGSTSEPIFSGRNGYVRRAFSVESPAPALMASDQARWAVDEPRSYPNTDTDITGPMAPDQPSQTLLTHGRPLTRSERTIADAATGTTRRALTIEEAKIIGSFPEPFVLIGSYADRWARIGNSVPPMLMRAIARDLRALLAHAEPAPDDLYSRAQAIDLQTIKPARRRRGRA